MYYFYGSCFKFKIIQYYICYIVGLFISNCYIGDIECGGWGRFRLVIIHVNIYALLWNYDRHVNKIAKQSKTKYMHLYALTICDETKK